MLYKKFLSYRAFLTIFLTLITMEEQKNSQPKWEAKVSARVTSASADQIWPLYTDFFNLHKWYPGLTTCHGIHGTNGEPGCIRFCSGFSVSSEGSGVDKGSENWAKERLIAVDHSGRSLSYEIVDSNIGFNSYVATVKIVPGADGDDHQNGCVIEWSFTVDPVEGWELEDMKQKFKVGLQGQAKRMEDAICQA
ncbi:PREDICTED: lachrymatory-factor synthase [Theobroma cacao]|uniref:Lachrymatory-factor synthase n=1 Tax=Theobroma cacao TaxID=3641 RepID=A0AB32WYC5_THECC|nr:PREDICTED: lachrymatory-factor synthase [Theobroma cacao]